MGLQKTALDGSDEKYSLVSTFSRIIISRSSRHSSGLSGPLMFLYHLYRVEHPWNSAGKSCGAFYIDLYRRLDLGCCGHCSSGSTESSWVGRILLITIMRSILPSY